MKRIATLKNMRLNTETREIIITIDAKDSVYVQEPKDYGFPQFMNSGPLSEGIPYLLEHHGYAVRAMKGNAEFQELIKENKRLKELLHSMPSFEAGNKVTIGGLTYQKGINENSFYEAIKNNA